MFSAWQSVLHVVASAATPQPSAPLASESDLKWQLIGLTGIICIAAAFWAHTQATSMLVKLKSNMGRVM